MKNKGNRYHFLFSGLVLFSILFQSLHSYEHLYEQMSKKICVHERKANQFDLTHTHHSNENCFICHFSISPFQLSDTVFLSVSKSEFFSTYNCTPTQPIFLFYKGSLFALRAPPTV